MENSLSLNAVQLGISAGGDARTTAGLETGATNLLAGRIHKLNSIPLSSSGGESS